MNIDNNDRLILEIVILSIVDDDNYYQIMQLISSNDKLNTLG